MNSVGYYAMIENELTENLQDLGNASGFDKEFFVDFVETLNIQASVQNYVSSFYSGDSTLVDTTLFKQNLYNAIDQYIIDKNYEQSQIAYDSIDNFVSAATDIYINQISIPFFSVIANYIYNTSGYITIAVIVLSVIALGIMALIFFTNQYRHRRFRYLCYGFAGGCLTTAVIPIFMLLFGKISQVNINTRSLYNLFVNYFNGFFSSFWIYVFIDLFFVLLTLFLYIKYYKKIRSNTN